MSALPALGYVGARRTLRTMRGARGVPWPLVGLVVAVALYALVQWLALRGAGADGEPDRELLDPILRFAPLLLPLALLRSTFSTPLRLQVAEVSWVLTAPGGPRALLTRELLLRPLGYAAVGYAGASIARAIVGRSLAEVWKVALAGALVGLALRLLVFGGHMLSVRARAAVPLRVVGVVWAAAMLAFGGVVSLRPVCEPLLTGVLRPSALSGAAVLIGLTALLVLTAALIASARGFEERAQAAARQIAEAQESLRRARSGEQLTMAAFRTRIPSLTGTSALAGERALGYRALVTQRRLILPSILAFGLALDVVVPLVLLAEAPDFTWAWAAVGLVGAAMSAASMLAVELEHHHMRMAPLRPLPSLLWLAAVPAAHRILSTEVAWVPMLFVPGYPAGVWLVGAVLIPCFVALVEGGGALAVVLADRMLPRALIRLGLGVAGVVPTAAVLIVAASVGAPAVAVALLVAATSLAIAATYFAFSARQIWPRRPLATDNG
ncbi:MAG: hypothetical protein QOH76_2809 [Thermoleophilaceae bacterium]|jgi:hypothetical protein|nr:hypothetical protein [Thermoleophilaceae bacterium]